MRHTEEYQGESFTIEGSDALGWTVNLTGHTYEDFHTAIRMAKRRIRKRDDLIQLGERLRQAEKDRIQMTEEGYPTK